MVTLNTVLTCKGPVEVLGRKIETTEAIELDWHTPASFSPPRYAIFLKKNNKTINIIRETKVFVLNFLRHTKEYEFQQGEKVDCPRIKNAKTCYECEVVNEIDTGDRILFLGKVLHRTKNL
jgi:flavin reductase (DIM6/NTAB) family NADH-FMN oxidoreductase RutF